MVIGNCSLLLVLGPAICISFLPYLPVTSTLVRSLFNAMLGDGLANYITRFLTNSERNPF